MACPSTHPISGSGRVDSGYYTSRSSALQYARDAINNRAAIEAGLALNGFTCPMEFCRTKVLGPVSVSNINEDTSLSLTASFFYLEWRYTAKITYDWSSQITCQSSITDQIRNFMREFRSGVTTRLTEFGDTIMWFEGWAGNLFSWFGWGEGCAAWADWIFSWLSQNGWRERLRRVRLCHYWVGIFKHQIVVITFNDGTEYVLDPWRDSENPIWEREDYEEKFKNLTCPE